MNHKTYIPKENRTVRAKEHETAVQKVQGRADLVRGMRDEGSSISEISRKTGFTPATVKRYLSDSFNPVNGHYGRKREGKLQRFRESVLEMRAQGKTYGHIYETSVLCTGGAVSPCLKAKS